MVGALASGRALPLAALGGQQQRVALARALVIEPSVLLLDEPLSNLDAHLRAEMRGEIRRLQQRLSITTLFVTHDQEEALAMSDRIAVMNKGRWWRPAGRRRSAIIRRMPSRPPSSARGRSSRAGAATDIFEAPGLVCDGRAGGRQGGRAARRALSLAERPGNPLKLEGVLSAAAYLGDTFELDLDTAAGRVRVIAPSTRRRRRSARPAASPRCRRPELPDLTQPEKPR